jgi:2'-5' RNA ligase
VSDPPEEFGLYFLVFPEQRAAARIETLARRYRAEYGFRGKPRPTSIFHVSLQNLGQYDELPLSAINERKANDAAAQVKANPFVVMFNRVESFSGGGGRYPLVLRGDDGVVGLEMLGRSLGVSMRMAGLKARFDFTPHLTLLYGERPIRERFIQPISWTVREFVLVRSLIGKSKYIRLGRWPLDA